MKIEKGIRYWFVQSFVMLGIIGPLFFFVGLQLYLFNNENPQFTIQTTFWLTLYMFVVLILVGGYLGIKGSYLFKGRLSDILLYVSTLRSGKFSERMPVFEKDEIGLICEELNQLAEFIQEQVYSMQRLANERSTLAQSAHTAAVIEERQRLARDLHDVVSQQLFALSMMSSATIRLFDTNPTRAKEQLEQIADIAAKAQGEMRALLLHLRPVELSNDSLCDGIIKLIQELKEKTTIHFKASIDEIEHISKAGEEHLFRIVQEALSNILRHSQASKVEITLTEKEEYVHLFIGDNGKGFDPQNEKVTSYGLKTMRERCEEVGGVFKVRSKLNEGAYINIRIPTIGGDSK
ncbi:sensor histidine kinase [Cytobacillus spongiae]|jgi:NarL family two-component system sensor histidine kinase LiaS|uniref:sensor histidine kinase n=1 Tax=Cytobacillus spongiae TaxID=2901381 RepID=UPI001F27AA69|nr:sensor histidine kinase [Cytobacillus spongiae]UII56895.1 sensor histidine kinase [Cytobacillus spongiae]